MNYLRHMNMNEYEILPIILSSCMKKSDEWQPLERLKQRAITCKTEHRRGGTVMKYFYDLRLTGSTTVLIESTAPSAHPSNLLKQTAISLVHHQRSLPSSPERIGESSTFRVFPMTRCFFQLLLCVIFGENSYKMYEFLCRIRRRRDISARQVFLTNMYD